MRGPSHPGTATGPAASVEVVAALLAPRTVAPAFRIVAVAEALSWAGLLAGMFVKYVLGTSEVGVQIFGPIHGGVFVGLRACVALRRRPGAALVRRHDAAGAGRRRCRRW